MVEYCEVSPIGCTYYTFKRAPCRIGRKKKPCERIALRKGKYSSIFGLEQLESRGTPPSPLQAAEKPAIQTNYMLQPE